jgi:hypothetical protein
MTPVMYSVFFLEGLPAAAAASLPGVRCPRSWLIEFATFSDNQMNKQCLSRQLSSRSSAYTIALASA